MCGPSSQEQQLANQGQSFSEMLQGNYGTLFGDQQGVLNSINKSLSPILAAGPSQQGFSAQERAALNTQAINSAGAASRNAQQAVGNFTAGQGGGGSTGILSGVTGQLKSAVASQAEGQLATAQNQITQADFAQGSSNYWKAQGGMDALAQGYSPNAAQTGAISSNQNAFGEANQIQTQKNQEQQAIAGGIEGLAGMATGGIANLDTSGGSSPFEQIQNFLGGA